MALVGEGLADFELLDGIHLLEDLLRREVPFEDGDAPGEEPLPEFGKRQRLVCGGNGHCEFDPSEPAGPGGEAQRGAAGVRFDAGGGVYFDSMKATRREFLGAALTAPAAAVPAAEKRRLIIDTHLEVWTLDPKFPFAHPERPNLKVPMAAPIENQVEQMKDFGLKYAVLINPRYYGWDNSYISYSLHKYPKLFVAHGLINPEDPKVHEKLRYWVKEHGFQGMRFSPIYHPKSTWLNSKEHYPLWKEAEKLGAVFNFYILPHQMPMLEDMAGRFPGVKI